MTSTIMQTIIQSIGAVGKDQEQVCMWLTKSSAVMMRWFDNNFMQANPNKFR